jgi:hypothetical protein
MNRLARERVAPPTKLKLLVVGLSSKGHLSICFMKFRMK